MTKPRCSCAGIAFVKSHSHASGIEAELRKRAKDVVPGTAERPVRRTKPTFVAIIRIDSVGTTSHIPVMAKTRLAPSKSSRSATAAVAVRASATDTKGSINLRIETGTRQLIDDAAAVLGKTRTEFMVESARRQAVDVLLDQRLFTLDSESYDAFMQALDNPPAPGPKLKALLRRTPAWQK